MAPPKVFVIGGTGAQGIPVISGLVKDGAYSVRALTRYPNSSRAAHLLSLGNVELVEGTFANEAHLRKGLEGCEFAFVNIDGFNAGEKTETFWAMRAYELALEVGIRFFVYGNLDYAYKKGGYNPIFRTGHYDGKGRVGEWILQQTRENGTKMGAALFTTGPYFEMALGAGTPMSPTIEEGVVTWRIPVGEGAIPFVSLDDCSYYVRWLFDHQSEAKGMDLEVAVEHVDPCEMAKAFANVTGKPARFEDIELDAFWSTTAFGRSAEMPAGYNADIQDPATMNMRTNFSGFFNLFKHSAVNKGVLQRDYALLDRIHPNRIRSAEEFFRREDEKKRAAGFVDGLYHTVENLRPVLKVREDGRKGIL